MTCFVDLIVDFLAVEDDDDAAACVMARLSIRVVNMAKMFSRIDTSSSSENVVVVVKIPHYFAIKSDDAQGVIRLNTHESNAHNLARGMTMTVYFCVEQTLAPSLSSSSLNE